MFIGLNEVQHLDAMPIGFLHSCYVCKSVQNRQHIESMPIGALIESEPLHSLISLKPVTVTHALLLKLAFL